MKVVKIFPVAASCSLWPAFPAAIAFCSAARTSRYTTSICRRPSRSRKRWANTRATSPALALAGKTAVSGGYDGRLIWWDIETRKQIRASKRTRNGFAKSPPPDGKTIASVADDMVCRLWDAGERQARSANCAAIRNRRRITFRRCCSPAPSRRTADSWPRPTRSATSSYGRPPRGKQAKTLEAPGMYTWDPVQRKHSIGGIRSLAFSPDGKYLAAGGISKIGNIDHLDGKARVEVFDWQKGEQTHEYADDKFKGLVEHLEFHPKGDWLLGGGGANDGFFLFFDLKTKKALRQEKASMHVHDFVLDEKAETIYAAGHGKIQMLEVKG